MRFITEEESESCKNMCQELIDDYRNRLLMSPPQMIKDIYNKYVTNKESY